jgi:hypothetical protein
LRQGRMPVAKKPVKLASPIKRHVAPKTAIPTVSKRPEGSHQHNRTDDARPPAQRYWHEMKRKNFL